MQTVAISDPAFLKAGGHTFHMTYDVVSGGVTNTVDKTDVCVQCHGPVSSFDMVKVDYNGDGVIEGVQTEVHRLLDKLSTFLPPDSSVKSSISVKTNWSQQQLKAAYNWQFVNNDGSFGVHNAQFAVGLLKASIADMTGDSNTDGLPDAWQSLYFGTNWVNNPNSAPNATPAGDGVPNWLKYALGLDPMKPGIVLPDGVVWANAGPGGGTDVLQIYTAAEIVFPTQLGSTYQIQSISQINGTWQNIGSPIAGTGKSMSYVTPTRNNAQQYYRVSHTP
jgi:hypothetical protein